MSTPTPLTSSAPIDKDLAEQAQPGHGIPSQDLDNAAQFPLEPGEAVREANSILVGGSMMAGSATGAVIGVAAAGPVGVVVGATLGAVAGALGGAFAGVAANIKHEILPHTKLESSNKLNQTSQKEFKLKKFVLSPEMLTFSGVFYPTGYVVVMFPNMRQAEQAARELVHGGYDSQSIMLVPPETFLREIAPVEGDSDIDLPSVGTDGATAQKFIKLARDGQFCLMVYADSDEDTAVVMTVARLQPFSYAQKYHMLAMEDLK